MIDLMSGGEKIVVDQHAMRYWIDEIEVDEYAFKFHGWAYIENMSSWKVETKIDFKGKNYGFSCKPALAYRHDVTKDHGHGRHNYDYAGFFIEVPRQNIGPDKYEIIFTFRNINTKEILLSCPFMCIEVP